MSERMNPDVKAKWLRALRSGKYVQGRGALRDAWDGGATHCCLGVLCDVYTNETRGADWSDILRRVEQQGEELTPDHVVDWAGLQGRDPMLAGRPASYRNDEGASFGELADLIEEHL